MTTEEFLTKARRLRSEADESERAFLAFLMAGESDRGIWDGSGLTYPGFLERHNLCRSSRYLQFKRVQETLGADETASVGVYAIVAAGRFETAAEQREVIDECRKGEEINGTSTSEQTAEKVANNLRQRGAGVKGRNHSYAALLDENERLRFEIKRLKDRTVALEAELKALKAKAPRAQVKKAG